LLKEFIRDIITEYSITLKCYKARNCGSCMPVVLATQEVEVGRSFEPRGSETAWAT
jgi:hypothetical protein